MYLGGKQCFRVSDWIYIVGEIDELMACEFIRVVENVPIEKGKKPVINLAINSGGGCCSSGHAMLNHMKKVKFKWGKVVNMHACHSMASTLFFNFPLERRYSYKFASFVLHDASTFQTESSKKEDLEKEVANLEWYNKTVYPYLKNSKMDIRKIKSIFQEDRSWDAKELIKFGWLKKSNILRGKKWL